MINLTGSSAGQSCIRVRPDRLAAGDRVLDPIVRGITARLHPQQHLVSP